MPSLIEAGAIIVDVRTPGEYAQGSAAGSINIPLDDLEKRVSGLDRAKTVIVCCASGARSAMAATILKSKGFQKVVNAGPWQNACV
ncbi:MAG: rhodanese-like domain-containing protein [Bdellovibrionales bacterium]|nr:rhodanese-like domain-containing protein [Bdellovibrionales bacterium]